MPRTLLLFAYFLSGGAGLIYELVWSRYLALFVGHSAEAAVLVIAMFLGGMSVGAFLVGHRSPRVRNPLKAYVIIELVLAVVGLAFHALFILATDLAYDVLFPVLPGPRTVQLFKWGIAAPMVFLPSVLLGATFPLMAAGVVRAFPEKTGRTLSLLYFLNSLGGAVALLVAGFALIRAFGLPGTSAAAAALNVSAAVLVATGLFLQHSTSKANEDAHPSAGSRDPVAPSIPLRPETVRFLLAASAITAFASFIYEIGWIRMLSLVMGSATHAFELMLSAFILGLALGALAIRRQADSSARPLVLLGHLQWLMGLLALATLPVYVASFGWMEALMGRVPPTDSGYLLFNGARYGMALAVMLPATFLAGTTLPLITNTLLRGGVGERSIGWVYALNTGGSIAGVGAAGLLLLPALGLKGMILFGATIDMALGLALLRMGSLAPEAPSKTAGSGSRSVLSAAALCALGVVVVTVGVDFNPALLTNGVFRHGNAAPLGSSLLYYADGRTATIGVHVTGPDSLRVLTTNGKPEASLTARWMRAYEEPVPAEPIRQQDESTQMLTALVSGAYAGGGKAAVIGQGSGVSGHFVLADTHFESVVTIEIEPRVIDASRLFSPANARVFEDPRSTLRIGDAKSFFANEAQTYDLILSEPSNPWVSGTSGLFSLEFYQRVRAHLTGSGVFAQWMQLYETDDFLLTTVLAALYQAFPDFHGYLVGSGDLMLVATNDERMADPDWSLLEDPVFRAEMAHVPVITSSQLQGLKVFTRDELAPLLDDWPTPNTDYAPILDLASEKARFTRSTASGINRLARDRFRVAAALGGWRLTEAEGAGVSIRGLTPQQQRANGFLARRTIDSLSPPAEDLVGVPEMVTVAMAGLLNPPADSSSAEWEDWVLDFVRVDGVLHAGTAGSPVSRFYELVRERLTTANPPQAAVQVVDFLEGLSHWNWEQAAQAGAWILERGEEDAETTWVPTGLLAPLPPDVLFDGAVTAAIKTGQLDLADRAYTRLLPLTRRPPKDFRLQLLRAHIESARVSPSEP
ncbi:MAG: fused MFS/spermidine synthase [Longimicrobiales bacterium]